MGDAIASAILAAVKRGAQSGVTFSADALVRTLRADFRWTDSQIADLLRCVRRAQPTSKTPAPAHEPT